MQAARLRDGSRRITHITEVMGMEGDVIITQDLFVYDMIGEDANGNLIGRHRSTGIGRPRFWERARYYGEEKRLAAALDAAEVAGERPDVTGTDRMNTIALFFLVAVAIGGVAWVFIYPLLSGERKAEKRKETVAQNRPVPRRAARARNTQKSRREQVEGTLKDLEARQAKAKSRAAGDADRAGRPDLVEAAVLHHRRRRSASSAFLFCLLDRRRPAGGARPWALRPDSACRSGCSSSSRSGAKRSSSTAFPDAVDIIVRGIKAGLPLLDSLRIIAIDAPEPLKSEFRAIVETQAIGMPIGEACAKLYERIPVPEANFFGIVISIQQKAGGNLSEALGNLSKVLRERKKMKAKIQAMSMEAKASAVDHRLPADRGDDARLHHQPAIHRAAVDPSDRPHDARRAAPSGCASGVMVMRKMINFDF